MATKADEHAYLSQETVGRYARDLAKQIEWLERHYPRRQDVIRDLVLALLCGENAVLLGPPGTGKSTLVRDVVSCFYPSTTTNLRLESPSPPPRAQGPDPDRVFFYPLSAGTRQEDLVGPYSAAGLLEDRYDRLTTHKLPEAECAILDEVFKASSETLEALLTPLNERQFYFGTSRGLQPIPLRCVIAMSNEVPEDLDESAALWDRFLFRVPIADLAGSERAAFLIASVSGKGHASRYGQRPEPLSPTRLDQMREDVDRVTVTPMLADHAAMVFGRFEAEGFMYSTRRLEKAIKVMRAHALMSGRAVVRQGDLRATAWTLWTERSDPARFNELVQEFLPDDGTNAVNLARDMLAQAESAFKEYHDLFENSTPTAEDLERRTQLGARLHHLLDQGRGVREQAQKDAFDVDGSAAHSSVELSRMDHLVQEIEYFVTQADQLQLRSASLPSWATQMGSTPAPSSDSGPASTPGGMVS